MLGDSILLLRDLGFDDFSLVGLGDPEHFGLSQDLLILASLSFEFLALLVRQLNARRYRRCDHAAFDRFTESPLWIVLRLLLHLDVGGVTIVNAHDAVWHVPGVEADAPEG